MILVYAISNINQNYLFIYLFFSLMNVFSILQSLTGSLSSGFHNGCHYATFITINLKDTQSLIDCNITMKLVGLFYIFTDLGLFLFYYFLMHVRWVFIRFELFNILFLLVNGLGSRFLLNKMVLY